MPTTYTDASLEGKWGRILTPEIAELMNFQKPPSYGSEEENISRKLCFLTSFPIFFLLCSLREKAEGTVYLSFIPPPSAG